MTLVTRYIINFSREKNKMTAFKAHHLIFLLKKLWKYVVYVSYVSQIDTMQSLFFHPHNVFLSDGELYLFGVEKYWQVAYALGIDAV